MNRDVLQTIAPNLAIINYCSTMKKDENSTLVFEDHHFESLDSDIVDLVFGCNAVSYFNLTGFGRPEKGSKVGRFAQILKIISSMIVPEDSPEEVDNQNEMENN